DLDTALVMVQNRVQLALPLLPVSVQNQGITIRKKTPDILNIINFYSPDGRYDDIYLSNFATIRVYDELLRIDGVSQINFLGVGNYSMRAWLNPQKLASLKMTASDVANAIRSQNLDAPAGQIGQPPASRSQPLQLPIDTLGRLTDPEQFGDIIVKVGQSRSTAPTAIVRAPAPRASGGFGLPTLGVSRQNGTTTAGTTSAGTIGSSTTSMTSTATPNSLFGFGRVGSTTPRSTVPGITATSSTTTSTGTTFTSTTGGGTTGGGANSSGGGTTGGGMTTPTGMTLASGITLANATATASTATAACATTTAGGASTIGTASGAVAGLSSNSGTDASTVGSGAISGQTIAQGPGRPSAGIVRLRDVARLELGDQNYNLGCTFDGRPSVGLAVFQLPGTNALNVANQIRAKMEELKADFPEGVDYAIAYDTTPFIRESVADVVQTLLEAVALVGVVVLIFLQNWRAALIPLVAVPVAIIGTFAVMAALRFSLNNISLFGLVLAIGIVVDDAIVVVENVERWLERGESSRDAARKAMDEVTGPVIAVALVLCAVFVPCAFISGITGQFFRQFAVTISVSTVFSAINSLTLSPALTALLLRRHDKEQAPPLPRLMLVILAGYLALVWLAPPLRDLLAPYSLPLRADEWLPSLIAGTIGVSIGWLVSKPLNATLGWSFAQFNRGFERATLWYGNLVGGLLRV
ncbi:MAG TPA: efflux RND transporter permease subunit, partial [Streptosporangiaceae bacterium]|nr:efflux RND transporter permease subunit [Streptosporangiaceae bacterium]